MTKKTTKPRRKQDRSKKTRNPSKRTLKSKAIKELRWKLKAEFPTGICALKGCEEKTGSPRREWCPPHRAGVRVAQMRVNNRTWRTKQSKSNKASKKARGPKLKRAA